MPERTLAKPLSGTEVVEAIVAKIRAQLSRDCYLTPHLGYASFSFQADIRVQFQNTGTAIKETQAHVRGEGGEVDPSIDMDSVDVNVCDEPKAPNEVRVESGQGVPTLVTTPKGGIEEKKVRYAPKGAPATTAKKALQQK